MTPRPATTWAASSPKRVGARPDPLRLRVGGPLKPSLAVEQVRIDYAGTPNRSQGRRTVTYTIHNTGNAILSARQTVSVSGPFGRLAVTCGQDRRRAAVAAG